MNPCACGHAQSLHTGPDRTGRVCFPSGSAAVPDCRCRRFDGPPRYPGSAELAAFRSAPHASMPPHHADDCGITDPPEGMAAWEDERADGIGYTEPRRWTFHDPSAHWRREAAAMRSRAYERAFGSWQYACNVARDRGYDAGDWRPFIATEPDRGRPSGIRAPVDPSARPEATPPAR